MFGGIDIMSLQSFNRVISFELNELLIALVLVAGLILVVKKIMLALKTAGKIDEHLRETRARISRAVTEIEEYNDMTDKLELELELEVEQDQKQELITDCVKETSIQVKIEDTKQLIDNLKQKKTRAMSMEERWAEYDKKRSLRSSGGTA